jgi:serine-type D-Ala-D-Ala endopeptidase (penicillin-binding protein 7)
MKDSRPYKHFTVLEWIVVFGVLFFLVFTSAEAKNTHKRHAVYNIHQRNMSVMITDITESKVLCATNAEEVRALASITKLMTAMIALDDDDDMNHKIMLSRNAGSHLPIREYTREELFHALLVKSDNGAAETLARNYPGGREAFLNRMNLRAKTIGMTGTYFDDPSGLSSKNVSTARDITIMVMAASYYAPIREITTKKSAYITTEGKRKHRVIVLNNTNRLILSQVDGVQLGKTGYTNPAGFCVAIMVEKIINNEKHYQVYVVMGAKNPKQRADEVKRLIYTQYGESNHETG